MSESLIKYFLDVLINGFSYLFLPLSIWMPNASHILFWQRSCRHFHQVYLLIRIAELPDSCLNVMAKLFVKRFITNANNFASRASINNLIPYDLPQHFLIGCDKISRCWLFNIVVVVCAEKDKHSWWDVIVLIFIRVLLRVIGISSEKRRHLGSSHSESIAHHSLPRNCFNSVISIEHIGEMDFPTLETVLNLFHFEKASRIGPTHHSERTRNAIAEEIKFIRISSLLFCKNSTLELNS